LKRGILLAVGVVGLLGALFLGAVGWRAWRDRGSIPFADGAAWTFVVSGPTPAPAGSATPQQDLVVLHVDGTADFKGTPAWLVSCERRSLGGSREVGRGFVENRFRGLDLIGAIGPFGLQPARMRLLPYPFPFGEEWTSKLGEGWTDRWKATSRGAYAAETVTVPFGTFESLHVSVDIRFAGQPPVASVDYWVARGVGPVKARVSGPEFDGTLELQGFSPGSPPP
jgi:hypothetical protein